METDILAQRLALAESKVQLLEKLIEDKSSELFAANKEIQEAHDYLENVINAMSSCLVTADAQGKIQSVNQVTLDMLGYEAEELHGQPLAILSPPSKHFDLSSITTPLISVARHETEFFTKTGEAIPVLCSSSSLYMGKAIAGVVCVAQDLSNYKKLEAQVLQSEKMASIGQLAAGVAHEINNPMGFIFSNLVTLNDYIGDISGLLQGYGELEEVVAAGDIAAIRERLKAIEAQKEEVDLNFLLGDIADLIKESRDGADRVRTIVLNLKEFSHLGRDEKKLADLNNGLEITLNIVWNELKYKVTLDKQYGVLPPITCFIQELNQVFMNLLVNAGQAIEEHGEISIRTYIEGSYACVDIADTGKGMASGVQARIFDPFYTTKDIGEGTGIGLSLAYQIVVEKHGGQLLVDSMEGVGSTFTVKIPIGLTSGDVI